MRDGNYQHKIQKDKQFPNRIKRNKEKYTTVQDEEREKKRHHYKETRIRLPFQQPQMNSKVGRILSAKC